MKAIQRLFKGLMPFIFIGILLVALAFSLVFFAYLLFFGIIIGLILFFFSWLRARFFRSKLPTTRPKKKGRIIDSDDWKNL